MRSTLVLLLSTVLFSCKATEDPQFPDGDADTDADTDADADADADLYDDCVNECVSLSEFNSFTGGDFYPNGDIAFSFQESHRCVDPTSPEASVDIYITDTMASRLNEPGFGNSEALTAVNTGASTWADISDVLLDDTVYPPAPVGSPTTSHVVVSTADPAIELSHPGSELGILAVTRQVPPGGNFLARDIVFWQQVVGEVDTDFDGVPDSTEIAPPGWTATGSGGTQGVPAVMTHEIGHALGVGHVLTSTNELHVMQPYAISGSLWFESAQAVEVMGYLYPVGNQPRLAGPCLPPADEQF